MMGDDGRWGSLMRCRALVPLVAAVCLAGCGRPASAPPAGRDVAGDGTQRTAEARPTVPRPAFPATGDGEEERAAAAMRDAAFDEAEELVRLEPGSATAWTILAALHRRYGDGEGAAALCERALEIDPRCADAHRHLGEAAFDAGALEEAERRYRQALASDPAGLEVAGQLADTLIRRADFTAAAELLEAFLSAHPRTADAWCMLGKARGRQGDAAASRAAYEKALEIDPASREAHQGMGRLLQSLGDDEAARPHLREVVRLDDETAKRHRERVAAGGDVEGSRVWMAKVHHDVGVLHSRRGDAARAERAWLASLDLDPSSAEARALLVALYAKTGRIEEALGLARARCERTPDDPAAWLDLSQGLVACGRTRAAEEALGKLLALEPDHAAGLALLARTVADRDPAAALDAARRAVEIEETAPHLYVLADMLLRTGMRDGAIDALEKAVRLAPGETRYATTLRKVREGR